MPASPTVPLETPRPCGWLEEESQSCTLPDLQRVSRGFLHRSKPLACGHFAFQAPAPERVYGPLEVALPALSLQRKALAQRRLVNLCHIGNPFLPLLLQHRICNAYSLYASPLTRCVQYLSVLMQIYLPSSAQVIVAMLNAWFFPKQKRIVSFFQVFPREEGK
jgi:hypothetical protein